MDDQAVDILFMILASAFMFGSGVTFAYGIIHLVDKHLDRYLAAREKEKSDLFMEDD